MFVHVCARVLQYEEYRLAKVVSDAMPEDHPLMPHVQRQLAVVQGNPFWKPEDKEKYMQRLVRELSSA